MSESDRARLAVAFKAEYPPRYDHTCRTYFGGRPQLPDGLKWPTVKTGGVKYALNFLGHIDLADVARSLPESPLPSEGVLFFFLDTSLITDGGLHDWEFDEASPGAFSTPLAGQRRANQQRRRQIESHVLVTLLKVGGCRTQGLLTNSVGQTIFSGGSGTIPSSFLAFPCIRFRWRAQRPELQMRTS